MRVMVTTLVVYVRYTSVTSGLPLELLEAYLCYPSQVLRCVMHVAAFLSEHLPFF